MPWNSLEDLRKKLAENANQGATGGGGPGGGQNNWGGYFGGIGQQTGKNTRPGAPEGGMVGTPALGQASELLRWASQVPGGMQYLQSIGMAPQISTMNVTNMGTHGSGGVNPMQPPKGYNDAGRGEMMGTPAYSTQFAGSPFRNEVRVENGIGGGRPLSAYGNFPAPNAPGGSNQLPGQQGFPGMPGAPGGGQSQPSSGFGGQLESTISGLLSNPTGLSGDQQTLLRTRAGDAAAGQQSINEQRTREDAVRRGASTSAGGDADIRSELNRVGAAGAAGQQRATQDVDLMLAQLAQSGRQGALSSGISLYGEQGRREQALRELELLLGQLQAQNGPIGGLQMMIGGR